MFNLLKDIHNRSEQMSGRKVLTAFILIFVVFLALGIFIGNLINPKLKEDEILKTDGTARQQEKESIYEGRIEYINPSFYPNDNLSYVLSDGSGKQIILLRAKDQKLSIAEGLYVKVRGVVAKTKDGKGDILNVSEVIIKNAAN
jgi:hypothetical protein